MTYEIIHRTSYEYSALVTVSRHTARIIPRASKTQLCERSRITIEPAPASRRDFHDYFGNAICSFAIQEPHRDFSVTARSRVRFVPPNESGTSALSPPWEEVAAAFRDPVAPGMVEPYQFVFDSPMLAVSPALADYARESFPKGTPLINGASHLTRRIYEDFDYDPVATTIATPLEDVIGERRGVCQDFAHIAIAMLRSLGLAARYVSGYLHTHPAPGRERLVGTDASHAWFSVFCPASGWVDFDPTNNLRPSHEHITVALGRDFSDVSPVSGVITGGGDHEVSVSVDVAEAK
jgi:transglutaminase-like putative cysteine protease